MNERFLQYIRLKGLSQRRLSDLSCVSVSTISRFCSGGTISSDKLQKLLQVCDDLSLEWLFFDSGSMMRSRGGMTVNMGAYAGADVLNDESVTVRDSSGVHVERSASGVRSEALAAKDAVIAERDRVISERDATIGRLQELLLSVSGK